MRILTFTRGADQNHRLGLLTTGDRVVDLCEWARGSNTPLPFAPSDILSLIEAGPAALEVVATLAREDVPTVPLTAVRLLAPIPRPRKDVVCVGWNYVEHFAEAGGVHRRGQDLPSHPTFFTKAPPASSGRTMRFPLTLPSRTKSIGKPNWRW